MAWCYRRHGVASAVAMMLALSAPIAHGRQGLPDFTELVRENGASVVNISTTSAPPSPPAPESEQPGRTPLEKYFDRFFEEQRRAPRFEGRSLGSGFVLASDGVILTNNHVVQNAEAIRVRLSDRREFDAELVGADPQSDLAVLHIDAEGLPAVRTGRAAELQVGEWVLAIGSPFGFETSVTAGIVSAKGRNLPQENYVSFVQTDVAINPGNSGGPLFNLDGEVVAVNSHIYSRTGGFMGVSFAIPIELAVDVAEQIRSNGRVVRGWLGVLIQDVDRELAGSLGMRFPRGAVVARVVPGSPAARAGLRRGDVIVDIGGRKVESADTLPPMVGGMPIGERTHVTVLREGERESLALTIAPLPENPRAGVDTEQTDPPAAQPREQSATRGSDRPRVPAI